MARHPKLSSKRFCSSPTTKLPQGRDADPLARRRRPLPALRLRPRHLPRERPGLEVLRKAPEAKFSLKVGTVFEDSPLAAVKWLPALWLLTNCKNGISSYELAGRSA